MSGLLLNIHLMRHTPIVAVSRRRQGAGHRSNKTMGRIEKKEVLSVVKLCLKTGEKEYRKKTMN